MIIKVSSTRHENFTMRNDILNIFRNIKLFLLLITLAASTSYAESSFPRPPIKPLCAHIESTSDAANCLMKELEDASERLNKVFVKIKQSQTEEKTSEVKNAQISWNAYKNEHCNWISKQKENPSEQHLGLISCKTDVTEKRIDSLSRALHTDKQTPTEYGDLSRWMNVVAFDYPDIFWQYHKRMRTDLNCDGTDEWIMLGNKIQTKDNTQQIDFTLAISDNPKTGRPRSELFTIPLDESSAAPHLCSPNIKIVANTDEIVEKTQCATHLKISDNQCTAIYLIWDDEQYKLIQNTPAEAAPAEHQEASENKEKNLK